MWLTVTDFSLSDLTFEVDLLYLWPTDPHIVFTFSLHGQRSDSAFLGRSWQVGKFARLMQGHL